MRLRFAVLILVALATACAALKPAGTADSLRQAADTFFRFQRWGPDLRGASQIVVPEAQQEWLGKALDAKDDDNLKLTEAELDDLKLRPDGTGTTVTKVTWHRLPSVSTRTDRVTVEWVDRSGTWFAVAVTGGPLPLLALPKAAPEPDAGAAP